MIVLLLRQMGFCSIVAAQSLSRLFSPRLGYFSSFSKKPTSERGSLPHLHTNSHRNPGLRSHPQHFASTASIPTRPPPQSIKVLRLALTHHRSFIRLRMASHNE